MCGYGRDGGPAPTPLPRPGSGTATSIAQTIRQRSRRRQVARRAARRDRQALQDAIISRGPGAQAEPQAHVPPAERPGLITPPDELDEVRPRLDGGAQPSQPLLPVNYVADYNPPPPAGNLAWDPSDPDGWRTERPELVPPAEHLRYYNRLQYHREALDEVHPRLDGGARPPQPLLPTNYRADDNPPPPPGGNPPRDSPDNDGRRPIVDHDDRPERLPGTSFVDVDGLPRTYSPLAQAYEYTGYFPQPLNTSGSPDGLPVPNVVNGELVPLEWAVRSRDWLRDASEVKEEEPLSPARSDSPEIKQERPCYLD